eukprot:14098708-Alexandrium_andersonii.AAC.1
MPIQASKQRSLTSSPPLSAPRVFEKHAKRIEAHGPSPFRTNSDTSACCRGFRTIALWRCART